MKACFITAILALISIPLYTNAQEQNKRFTYQGEVDMAYSFGFDDETSNINLEVINGVRFSRYLFAGIGIGAAANFSDEAIVFPIYLDVKGFLPVSDKADLVAGMDIGTKLDYTYDMTGGLLLRPEFGVNFPLSGKLGLKVTAFYEYYSFKETILNTQITAKLNYLGVKLGLTF